MALALSSHELDHHFAALGEIRKAIDQATARGAPAQEVAALIKQYGPWLDAIHRLTNPYTEWVGPPVFNPIPPSMR